MPDLPMMPSLVAQMVNVSAKTTPWRVTRSVYVTDTRMMPFKVQTSAVGVTKSTKPNYPLEQLSYTPSVSCDSRSAIWRSRSFAAC